MVVRPSLGSCDERVLNFDPRSDITTFLRSDKNIAYIIPVEARLRIHKKSKYIFPKRMAMNNSNFSHQQHNINRINKIRFLTNKYGYNHTFEQYVWDAEWIVWNETGTSVSWRLGCAWENTVK